MRKIKKNSFFQRVKRLFKGEYSFRLLFIKLLKKLPDPLVIYKILRKIDRVKVDVSGSVILPGLKDYNGITQFVHPDAVSCGGEVIIAATPYPYSDDRYENPVLFRTKDMVSFCALNKGKPIAYPKYTSCGKCYLSDPDLVCAGGRIFMLYREYEQRENAVCKIYSIYTDDLVSWTKPLLLYCGPERSFVCPASVYDGEYITFFIRFTGENSQVFRSSGKQPDISGSKAVSVNGIPPGRGIWHIDVFCENGVYYGLFLLNISKKDDVILDSKEETVLYSAISNDKGKSWELIKKINPFGDNMKYFLRLYRSSFIRFNSECHMLFSAETKKGQWFTYLERNIKLEKYFEIKE